MVEGRQRQKNECKDLVSAPTVNVFQEEEIRPCTFFFFLHPLNVKFYWTCWVFFEDTFETPQVEVPIQD